MEIKHYTLNTGNMQVVKETEINSNPIFRLKPLVSGNFYSQLKQLVDSARRGEKAHMFDHTYFVIIEDKNHTKGYFCTLYVKRNEEYIPILTTCGAKDPDDFFVWDHIQEMAKQECKDNYVIKVPVTTPYIVDLLHTSAVAYPQIMSWTGDFSQFIGWIMLYPDLLKSRL